MRTSSLAWAQQHCKKGNQRLQYCNKLYLDWFDRTKYWTCFQFENNSILEMRDTDVTPSALTEVNITCSTNRCPTQCFREKVFAEGFHWKSIIFNKLPPWNGDVTLNLLLNPTRSLSVFAAPLYMTLVYVSSRCTDSVGCMEVSLWSCNSDHTMVFMKNGGQTPG